jgi:hypothetical protein
MPHASHRWGVYGVIRGLLDRIILVAAIVVAGCIPSFIAQYRQRLGGRLDQVRADLSLFQEIADRYHGGSLEKLIEAHLASADKTFHDEGVAIQSMVETAQRLEQAVNALNADLIHQVAYLLRHGEAQIASATWDVFQPAFPLTVESVVFALSIGVVIWLLFLAVWQLVAVAIRRLTRAQRRLRA